MKTVLLDFLSLLKFSIEEGRRIKERIASTERYYQKKMKATEDGNKIAMLESILKQRLFEAHARYNALFSPGSSCDYNVVKFTPKAYRLEPVHLPHIHIRLSEEESKLFEKAIEKAGFKPSTKAVVTMRVYFDEEKTKIVKFKIENYKEVF